MFKLVLSEESIHSLVNPFELLNDIRRVLESDADEAPRSNIQTGRTWYASMTSGGLGLLVTKMVGVFIDNPALGLPLVRAVTAVFRADTGEPLLLYESNTATAYRTAAATALALQLLDAPRRGVLGIIGAGVQATYHALVLREIFEPDTILVTSRREERAKALAEKIGGEVAERRSLLKASDIVVAATTSSTPVVEGALLRKGAVVASIGAPSPVRELDLNVGRRGKCLLADTREGVLKESRDYKGFERVVDLREVLRGEDECTPGEIKVYKSVGRSLFDLAISLHLVEKLLGKAVV